MTDILVRPVELKQAAEQLRSRAEKLSQALQIIDKSILSLKADKFLGNRANAVQAHYTSKRQALLRAKDVVTHFSGEMDQAAFTFEKADQYDISHSEPTPAPRPKPKPDSMPAKKMPPVKDFVVNQWDAQWRKVRMNDQTGETLGEYGCLMTVVSMISRIYGVDTNPALVDKWIEAHGGYPANGSYMTTTMQAAFLNDMLDKKGSMSTIYSENAADRGLPNISQNLDAGIPVILHIESNINPQDGHFVLAVGMDSDGNYVCADPNGGKQVIVSADKIRDARVYK